MFTPRASIPNSVTAEAVTAAGIGMLALGAIRLEGSCLSAERGFGYRHSSHLPISPGLGSEAP